MSDPLNNTIDQQLTQKLNQNESNYVDDHPRYKKITHIEMTNGKLENQEEKQVENENEFKRIDTQLSNTYNSIEEEDEKGFKRQGQSFVNKVLINFIWGIRQTLNVIIFVKKMKYYSRGYLFKSMTRQSFNVLGDQSSEYDYYVANNYIQSKEKMSILQRWRKIRQKRYIFQDYLRKIEGHFYNCFRKIIRTISPRNKLKIAWDAIVYFILTINIFYVPIYLSWGDSMLATNKSHQQIFNLVLNDIPGWVFFFDILLNCITCYYEEGKLITKRRKIFVHYFKGKFWGDIIVVLPFLINQYFHIKYLNIILLLRVNNMIKRMNQFEEMIDLNPSQQLLYDFLKIMTTIIFISHFVGCFYFFLGQIEISFGIEENWIYFYKIPRDFFSEYIYSIYWATITMVTIGYGDVAPQSSYERVYVMLVALIGCCYYAAILSFIGNVLISF